MHWTRSGSGSCMRAMPRSETVREPQEVLFVQHAVGTVLSQIWIVFARMDGQVSPASHRGSTDPPPHQEMAEGRRTRGWRVVGNEKGDSARLGDFTAALQRLPSLCLRPLGTALANASSHGRGDRGSLCGRHGAGVSVSSGSRAFSPRLAGTSAEVRTGTTSGQDTPD